ncbi:hypothetical protein ACOSP7_003010 [Xanthoceras sorbifolium]
MAGLVQHCEVDRLTNLPNPIIYHILSFMEIKYAVRTCVLSSKWRYHWRGIHSLHLEFTCSRFCKEKFGRFVLHVLHHRRPSKLRKLTFYFRNSRKGPPYMKRIFEYAISNEVEELRTNDLGAFSLSRECETLRTLEVHYLYMRTGFPSMFGFASLTTLQLSNVTLPSYIVVSLNNVFSNCLNLENLYLIKCSMGGNLTISAPNLVNLVITKLKCEVNNPQPSIMGRKIVIESAPRLQFVDFSAINPMEMSIHECPKLEKVNIRTSPPVAWRERNSYSSSYRLVVILTAQYTSNSVAVLLNFFRGKLVSHCVYINPETKIMKSEKRSVIEHLWFFDGARVWKSIPRCLD